MGKKTTVRKTKKGATIISTEKVADFDWSKLQKTFIKKTIKDYAKMGVVITGDEKEGYTYTYDKDGISSQSFCTFFRDMVEDLESEGFVTPFRKTLQEFPYSSERLLGNDEAQEKERTAKQRLKRTFDLDETLVRKVFGDTVSTNLKATKAKATGIRIGARDGRATDHQMFVTAVGGTIYMATSVAAGAMLGIKPKEAAALHEALFDAERAARKQRDKAKRAASKVEKGTLKDRYKALKAKGKPKPLTKKQKDALKDLVQDMPPAG